MSEAKITVTRVKEIEHNDPDAAGFTDGYRWRVVDHLGTVESYAPTKAEAQAAAEAVAEDRANR